MPCNNVWLVRLMVVLYMIPCATRQRTQHISPTFITQDCQAVVATITTLTAKTKGLIRVVWKLGNAKSLHDDRTVSITEVDQTEQQANTLSMTTTNLADCWSGIQHIAGHQPVLESLLAMVENRRRSCRRGRSEERSVYDDVGSSTLDGRVPEESVRDESLGQVGCPGTGGGAIHRECMSEHQGESSMSLQGVGGSSDAFVGVSVDNSDLYVERRLRSSVESEQHTRASIYIAESAASEEAV